MNDQMSKKITGLVTKLRKLQKAVRDFNKGVRITATTTNDSSASTKRLVAQIEKLKRALAALKSPGKSFDSIRDGANGAKSAVSSLTKQLKKLGAAYLGIMGIGAILDTADTITAAQNKLGTVNRAISPNASEEAIKAQTQGQLDDIYASAQRSRGSYTETVSNVGKMMVNAGDAFDNNIDKAILFNELMSKSYTIGGASQQEQRSSMYQLVQALGANTLAGDELRSVKEGAQVAYQYIEKYAQALYDTDKPLKDLASEGLITADVVTNAILKNQAEIEGMFEKTSVTFEQTWEMGKNAFIKAFEPVLKKLTEILNSEQFQAFVSDLTGLFVVIANIILNVIDWVSRLWVTVKIFIQNNSQLIRGVLIAALVVVIGILGILAVKAIITGTTMVASFIAANWPFILIIAVIAGIIVALVAFGDQVA